MMYYDHRSRSFLFSLICILVLANPLLCLRVEALNPTTKYGMNAEGPSYYSTDALFVDMLMHAGSWNTSVALTASGYPTSGTAQSYFTVWGYPSGQYSFYGEGDFDLSFNGNYNPTVVPGTLSKTGNVTTCKVLINTPPPILGGFNVAQSIPLSWITVSNINPSNPPNNFKLIRPDYPANTTAVFGKEFLQAAGPFSCLRFMDWMNTNGSTVTNWASRPQPGVWGTRAFAYENMIALCNQLNTDMWINIPLYATPDWASNMATLIKQNLKPNLHVHYEVGNELWNTGFAAWSQVDTWAQANGFGTSWYGHGEEMGLLLMSWANIMQPILGTQGRPILAGQFVVTDYCSGGLHYIAQQYGPPANFIYGIAGAPYVSPSNSPPITSTDDVFTQMNAALTQTGPQLQSNITLANQYKIKFLCYEAGDGLSTLDQNLYNIFSAAEQDPRMEGVINGLVKVLNGQGTDLANFFTFTGVWSKFGFWAFLPDIRFISNPTYKYLAASAAASAGNTGIATNPGGSSGGSTSGGTVGNPSKSGKNGLVWDNKHHRWEVVNSPWFWDKTHHRWELNPYSPFYKRITAKKLVAPNIKDDKSITLSKAL